MVFYVIACSLAGQEEPDLERFVVSCMGPQHKPLGEVYAVPVSYSPLNWDYVSESATDLLNHI